MWILLFQTWWALAGGLGCDSSPEDEKLAAWADSVQSAAGSLLTAGKVCSETLSSYKSSGCKIQDIRGLFSPQSSEEREANGSSNALPKKFPPQIPGGYLRRMENCSGDFQRVKDASVAFVRKPALAGNIPRTDACIERNYSPPGYYHRITKTVTKRDPKDYSKSKMFSVVEDFDYDPSQGARLRMVSVAGDEIRCYGGEFDPEKKAEVQYLYCVYQGKKISVPRKDQFSVISNGRFSVSDALQLPEPQDFQGDPNWKMRPDQKIPPPSF